MDNIKAAIAELQSRKAKIDDAIAALKSVGDGASKLTIVSDGGHGQRHRLSSEGRAAIAAAAKKRWAKVRREAAKKSAVAKPKAKAAPKPKAKTAKPKPARKPAAKAKVKTAPRKPVAKPKVDVTVQDLDRDFEGPINN